MTQQKSELQEQILRHVEAGKDGAFAVLRGSDGLIFRAARKALPVIDLRVYLTADGDRYAWSGESFQGMLLADDRGGYGREARLAVVDATGRPMVSSDAGTLVGRIMVVAQGTRPDGKMFPLTAVALFALQPGETGRSALLIDASEEFLYFADLDRDLLQGGSNDDRII